MKKRFLAMLLVLAMVLAYVPGLAMAAEVKVNTAEDLITAVANAQAGDTITLTGDITLTAILTIDKAITLDGGDHKLTSSAGRAINVDVNGEVTIKNLTIVCSGERGVNIINKPANVTLTNLNITAKNYAVMVADSAAGATVAVNSSVLSGLNVFNMGPNANQSEATINNTTIYSNDPAGTKEAYGAIMIGGAESKVDVEGCSIYYKDNSFPVYIVGAGASVTFGEGVKCYKDDVEVEPYASAGVAMIRYGSYFYAFRSLSSAIARAKDGETVIVVANEITESISMKLDKSITIEGNGVTMTGGMWLGNDAYSYGDGTKEEISVTITGFNFVNKGLAVVEIENVTICDNTFTNITETMSTSIPEANAIILWYAETVNVSDNTIIGAGEAGIQCCYISGTATLTGNHVKNTGHNSMQVTASTGTAVVTGNTMENWGTGEDNGRAFRGQVTGLIFNNNTMKHANAPEQYIKVDKFTDSSKIDLNDNYWGGHDPADDGIVVADGVTVGDKFVDVSADVSATSGNASIAPGVVDTNVQNNITSVTTNTDTKNDLQKAADKLKTDKDVVGTADAAKDAIESANNASLDGGAAVTVKVQPYLDVQVKSAATQGTNKTMTVEIDAYYDVVAVATQGDETVGTATLKEKQELTVTEPITITIPLPADFVTGTSDKVYIHHYKDNGSRYTYEATVTGDATNGFFATFVNPNGFSTFEVSKSSTPSQVKFWGAKVQVANTLNMGFFFEKAQRDDWTGCYAVVQMNGQNYTHALSQWETDETGYYYYVYFTGIYAYMMDAEVAVTLYNASGEVISETLTTSISQCATALKNDNPEKYGDVVDALLAYGAAAKAFFAANSGS